MDHQQHIRDLALALINAQSTMSLATAKAGHAWAAPVYYAFHEAMLYFFSSPESRHITEGLDAGEAQVSATIYPASSTWEEIKGIQMSGNIRSAGIGLNSMQAFRAYTAKFPFIRDFFKMDKLPDLENFKKRFHVRLYFFEPTQVFYLDNQIRFGFREEIILN